MLFRLQNTLTRQKEAFAPLAPGRIGMYVCGVTVYDYCHVGHARVCVVFDVVQRTLRHLGYDLTYVRNFTDVDDKIIARANANGESVESLTERFIQAFYEDMDRLDCQRPDIEPRVTTHMGEIIDMVQQIVARGHGYVVASEPVPVNDQPMATSDVYFSVESFPTYGSLSRRVQEDNADGASERVSFDGRKKDQRDFALWKAAKPGEPWWPSPWGPGRPGWHIECSAMACKHLGGAFDIHGGGKDLVFPHHENEIAQAQAATGDAFAKHWMHNGFVTIDSEKMAKSTGNFFTIRDVLARFHPQVLRYFLLTAHYTHPLNFSDKAMDEAAKRVLNVYEKLAQADELLARQPTAATGKPPAVVEVAQAELMEALCDDFNTPRALAALSEPITVLTAALAKPKAAGNMECIAHVRGFIARAADLLGVFQYPAAQLSELIVELARDSMFPPGSEGLAWVLDKMRERDTARSDKNWARSDELRAELLQGGVEVRDTREGSMWRPRLAID